MDKETKMVKFMIINQKIIKEKTNLSEAYDATSNRVYIREIPSIRVKSLVSQLLKLSKLKTVLAIQIEFDRYNEQYNVEIEIYLVTENNNSQLPNTHFKLQDIPCSFVTSKRFYNKMISFLEKISN